MLNLPPEILEEIFDFSNIKTGHICSYFHNIYVAFDYPPILRLDWGTTYKYYIFKIRFIEKFLSKINWDYMVRYSIITEDIIETYGKYLNWRQISISQELSDDMYMLYAHRVDWSAYFQYRKVDNPVIIREFWKKSHCKIIPKTYDIAFLEEFEEIINWRAYSEYIVRAPSQKIGEILTKFAHCLNWDYISSACGQLEYDVLLKVRKYINWRKYSHENPINDPHIISTFLPEISKYGIYTKNTDELFLREHRELILNHRNLKARGKDYSYVEEFFEFLNIDFVIENYGLNKYLINKLLS